MKSLSVEQSVHMVKLGWWQGELYLSNAPGVYASMPPDVLHTVSHGLVDMLREILLEHARVAPSAVFELDRRLALIPPVS